MVRTMKVTCNVCYADELEIHDYDGKLYADPCPKCFKETNDAHEEALTQQYDSGYDEGEADTRAVA